MTLKRMTPSQFADGGERLCAAITAGSEVLGAIVLGDRVNGTPFTAEDKELIQTIANQTANGLLHLHNSERLQQSREMEAFQIMSAFFVHDLKNTA